MPRKHRATKSLRQARLAPAVLEYFDTGSVTVPYQGATEDWIALVLDGPEGRRARALWLAGDQAGAEAILRALPGRLFA